MNLLQKIQEWFRSDAVLYSRHARIEMKEEEFGRIMEHEVDEAVTTGEVIEEYPDDTPYPSVLIFGKTRNGRFLHVVCAYNQQDQMAIIVTVYQPNPELWIEYRRRKP